MGNGKIFCLIGGILTLISTYLLGFGYVPVNGNAFYGIAFIVNLGVVFDDMFSYAILFSGGEVVVYLIIAALILFLVSGVLLLLGTKNRIPAIIGSIMPIFISLIFVSYFFDILFSGEILYISSFMYRPSIVDGLLPLHVNVGNFGSWEMSLGTYVLLIGGIIGLIGGIKGTD